MQRPDAEQVRELLKNIVDACGDGIVVSDGNGLITNVNESFLKIIGKARDAIIGKTYSQLGPISGTFMSTSGETITLDQAYKNDQLSKVEQIRELSDGGKIENWQWYAFNDAHEVVPLEGTISIQKNRQGDITGFIAIFRDITDRIQTERQLRDAYQFRNRFFTNVTHEFRTPLTLILGPLESIVRGEFGNVNQGIRQQLDVSLNNARQLLKLVNQLLDISMIESGSQKMIYERRDLKKYVAAILDSFMFIARSKKIMLSFVADEGLSAVHIDPAKLEKVLFNLLGNAFKFTPEGGAIAVTLGHSAPAAGNAADTGSTVITIADTGLGIPPGEVEHIFDRFKFGSGSSPSCAGSGIGLAHAKELVDLMHGSITVRSEPGKGSAFSVTIPCVAHTDGETAAISSPARENLYLQPDVEFSDLARNVAAGNEECITGEKPLVLVVDDNTDMRRYITAIVEKEYDFMTADNGRTALQCVGRRRPDLIVCDVLMPEMDGRELLRALKASAELQAIPCILLTALGGADMAAGGLEEGADDYIVKPFNSLELLARIKAQLRIRELANKTQEQKKHITLLTGKLRQRYAYGNIIGGSSAMRKIYQIMESIKKTDATVLILGETGTGKELVANAIHYSSSRAAKPMLSVNCAAIPRELMEREFFGHIKGAYTGAVESRKGYFAEADGGTLFLDEIGEMDINMQVKLLRVLERGEILRVGDTVAKKVNVRIIAATNKDLRAEVLRGAFREDLFFRIYVLPIYIPPLRERIEDIPPLIDYFIEKFAKKYRSRFAAPSKKQLGMCMSYAFPGNVRELENMIERFCLLGGRQDSLMLETSIGTKDFLAGPPDSVPLQVAHPLKSASDTARFKVEREIIRSALRSCNNNRTKTAQQLNICRASLYRKLKKFDLA